jgi:hypothetical protein
MIHGVGILFFASGLTGGRSCSYQNLRGASMMPERQGFKFKLKRQANGDTTDDAGWYATVEKS